MAAPAPFRFPHRTTPSRICLCLPLCSASALASECVLFLSTHSSCANALPLFPVRLQNSISPLFIPYRFFFPTKTLSASLRKQVPFFFCLFSLPRLLPVSSLFSPSTVSLDLSVKINVDPVFLDTCIRVHQQVGILSSPLSPTDTLVSPTTTIMTPVFGRRGAGGSLPTICLRSTWSIILIFGSKVYVCSKNCPGKNGMHTMRFEGRRRDTSGETPVFGQFSARIVTISHGCRGCRPSEMPVSSPNDP